MAKAGKGTRPEEAGESISAPAVETTRAEAADDLTTEALSSPTTEQIQQRAYELYIARGGDEGNDIEDWLQAERELGQTGTSQDIS